MTARKSAKYVLSVFLILLIIAGVISCKQERLVNESGPTNSSSDKQDNRQEVWSCPMHPQIKKAGRGKCPICGMDLVRAVLTENISELSQDKLPDGHSKFRLSDARIQMIGVKYGVVEKRPLFKLIEAAGRVAFDPELYTAQNEYLEALRQVDRVKNAPLPDVKHSATRMMESAKLRLKILGLSDSQISNLEKKGSVTTGSNLLVPTAGENIWVYAEVFEMDLSHIKPGLQVTITGGALEGKELFGKVISVDRVINPSTRTAKVRVLVPNAKGELRPESYVDATIHAPLGEQIIVPFDAILDSGKESWVFVSKVKGRFEPRKVIVKYHAGEQVAIASGLEPGEKIVTSANFLIDSESRLKSVLNAYSSEINPKSLPQKKCPDGQKWHDQMKHCMPVDG